MYHSLPVVKSLSVLISMLYLARAPGLDVVIAVYIPLNTNVVLMISYSAVPIN